MDDRACPCSSLEGKRREHANSFPELRLESGNVRQRLALRAVLSYGVEVVVAYPSAGTALPGRYIKWNSVVNQDRLSWDWLGNSLGS